jgi:uncharacterized protein DUF6454
MIRWGTTRTRLAAAAAAVLMATAFTAGVAAAADAGTARAARHPHDGALAHAFKAVDRKTAWTLTSRMQLRFPTFHTEGLVVAGPRIFLSAVEILEPTVTYPSPRGGYDRTPGKGVGHVFVLDRQGNLQRDIVLGKGDMYHPGGMDSDGRNVWVPVAQYRPDSSAIIYRINARTLKVHEQFRVHDHIGGIVRDATTGHLVGNNWGSRRFYEWTVSGRQRDVWNNVSHFVDYQDCQYVRRAKMLCGGVTNLPQTPAAGGAAATYELGGIALISLRSHRILHEVPFQQWSSAGHVVTRNPLKLRAVGGHLQLWAAPDNGDEGNGTELLTYAADVG